MVVATSTFHPLFQFLRVAFAVNWTKRGGGERPRYANIFLQHTGREQAVDLVAAVNL